MMIRNGHPGDLNELQQLFADTIRSICRADYNHEQIEVWASGIENKQRWHKVLTNQFVLVAQDKGNIAGFCTLDNGNYIDLLYIRKDYQRQGIALRLYTGIENEAKRQGQTLLTSDVSKTARPFFEKQGFKVLKEQVVNINGVELTNYKMTKMMV